MKRWNSFLDLIVVGRARWAQNSGNLEKALKLLEHEPRPGSIYARLIPLYRLTLMTALQDPRRSELARSIAAPEWSEKRKMDCKSNDGERADYLDAYRRWLCSGVLGKMDEAEAAAVELHRLQPDVFTSNTLRRPIPRESDFYS